MKIPFEWNRDEAIELCLEALATGCVLGVSANHDPDLLTTGTSFGQNSDSALSMCRTWDLFEAYFGRWQAEVGWRCQFLMVQPWRIKKPPKFSMLRKELHRHGFEVDEGVTEAGSEYRTVAASGSRANIDRDNEKYLGRVMKIYLPAMPPFVRPAPRPVRQASPVAPAFPAAPAPPARPRRRTSAEFQAIVRELDTTARGSESSWPEWFDRLLPSPDELIWHLALLRSLHLHLEAPGRAMAWGVFGRWLLDQARTRSFWATDEWTWRWSDFVVDFPDLARPGEVARECLAALPMTPAEAAAVPSDWRSRTPEDVRRERVTQALLRFAVDDVPPPPAPEPALAAWHSYLSTPNSPKPDKVPPRAAGPLPRNALAGMRAAPIRVE